MTARRTTTVLVLLLALATRPLPAQSAADLLSRAARAYRNLELDAAAGYLRQALAAEAPDTLLTGERAAALMYLFSTETLRERRDTATAVARELLALDPRFEPDRMIFPPSIVRAVAEARRTIKLVAVRAPPTFLFRGDGSLPVHLVATSPHEVAVVVTQEGGSPLRVLYSGWISDSLELQWNGLDAEGVPAASGRYALLVTSRDGREQVVFERRLALDIATDQSLRRPRGTGRAPPAGAAPAAAPRATAPPPMPPAGRPGLLVGLGAVAYGVTALAGPARETMRGAGLAASLAAASGPFALQLEYREASLDGGPGHVVVDAEAMAGIRPIRWLAVSAGPRVRALVTDSGRDRWVLWQARLDAAGVLVRDRLDAFAGTWGVAYGSASSGAALSGGWGAELGVAARLPLRGARLRLGYRVDQAAAQGGPGRVTSGAASLLLVVEPAVLLR